MIKWIGCASICLCKPVHREADEKVSRQWVYVHRAPEVVLQNMNALKVIFGAPVRHAMLTQHDIQIPDREDPGLSTEAISGGLWTPKNSLAGPTSVELVTSRMDAPLLDTRTIVGLFIPIRVPLLTTLEPSAFKQSGIRRSMSSPNQDTETCSEEGREAEPP